MNRNFRSGAIGSRISQLETIRSTLQTMIDEDEVHTSTWMPGNDWTETPWFPIYEDACDNNFEDAAKCFGIFVWEAFMNHPASWSFIRLDMSGRQFAGAHIFSYPSIIDD